MSVEKMAAVLHHAPVRGTAKLLLVGIANHEGDGGAWPAMATLAQYANVSERNAIKMIRVLQEKGLVEVIERLGRTNIFRTMVECPHDCDGSTNHRYAPQIVPRPTPVGSDTPDASDTPTPVASDTPPLSVATPEPLLNHQVNQYTHNAEIEFERFWNIYPKKTGRADAFDEFERRDLKWDAIIDGAIRYLESEIMDGEQRWVKSPANFIRDETWRQRFKPGIAARRREANEKRAAAVQINKTEIRELPPKCIHNPEQSVLRCEECKNEWLAQP
jgi:hypothetical protein